MLHGCCRHGKPKRVNRARCMSEWTWHLQFPSDHAFHGPGMDRHLRPEGRRPKSVSQAGVRGATASRHGMAEVAREMGACSYKELSVRATMAPWHFPIRASRKQARRCKTLCVLNVSANSIASCAFRMLCDVCGTGHGLQGQVVQSNSTNSRCCASGGPCASHACSAVPPRETVS